MTIADLHRAGESLRGIGRALGRPASTIKRELDARCRGGIYQPYAAQRAWVESRSRPKPRKLAGPSALGDYVQDKLAVKWSPEQISHTLIKEFPHDESMRVSHETIYQALYVQARGRMRREVAAAPDRQDPPQTTPTSRPAHLAIRRRDGADQRTPTRGRGSCGARTLGR